VTTTASDGSSRKNGEYAMRERVETPPYDRDAARDLEQLRILVLTPGLRTWHMCRRYLEEGWSAGRIAEEMGMTEAAVRKVVGRSLKKLDALNGTKVSRFELFFKKKG
jgi:DNA-directed RNA polymerase specialized sigma24 family protein